MKKTKFSNLTQMELSTLEEVGTIGGAHAATSLSYMLGRKIGIQVPKTQCLPLSQVPDILGGTEKVVRAVCFKLLTQVSGSLLLIFSKEESAKLVQVLLGDEKSLDKRSIANVFTEYEESSFKELANITASSYISSLSNLVQQKIPYSIPALATDMLGAILQEVLIPWAEQADQAVIVETTFEISKQKISGHFLLVPDPMGMRSILNALRRGS